MNSHHLPNAQNLADWQGQHGAFVALQIPQAPPTSIKNQLANSATIFLLGRILGHKISRPFYNQQK